MPALRERRNDIPLLASRFLLDLCGTNAADRKFFSIAAVRKLEAHDWPGNVRELMNVVQRAFIFAAGVRIEADEVPLPRLSTVHSDEGAISFRAARAEALSGFERCYVERLLEKHGGNVTRAAREAQKERRAFGRLIKKYQIDKGRFGYGGRA
jgi:DNA-binding NtrC family response regulator